ncbi:MAG: hypothetical protein HQL60_07690 [Magnetococcales bacterium]|nr:hypothetical protein [Magnetococcales bacterium]
MVVRKIERSVLPDDDELCAKLGTPKEDGITLVRQRLRERVTDSLHHVTQYHIRSQVYKTVIQANPLDVPDDFIQDSLTHIVEQKKQIAKTQGRDWRHTWADEQAIRDAFFDQARDSVAGTFLMMAIGRKHGIEFSTQTVENYLANFDGSPERRQSMETYVAQNLNQEDRQKASEFMMDIVESEVVRWIIERADVVVTPIGYTEFKQSMGDAI